MQLKLQRSQRAGGIVSNTVIFCLDARAEYSPGEAANIAKYKLGNQIVYNSEAARRHLEHAGAQFDRTQSGGTGERATGLMRGAASLALAKMKLNISVESLGRGQHIECKDLPELLDAEQALMDACRNIKQFLDTAATFNGSIVLVDFDKGEKVDISAGTLDIIPPTPPPSRAIPRNEEPRPDEKRLPDGLTPTDLAQLEFGNTEDFLAELGKNVNQFRVEYPETFWLFAVGAPIALFLLFYAAL